MSNKQILIFALFMFATILSVALLYEPAQKELVEMNSKYDARHQVSSACKRYLEVVDVD